MFEDEGFHWRDHMFWKRLDNGSVRIRLFATRVSGEVLDGDDEEPVREWVIPAAEWVTILSALGEKVGKTK